MTADLSSTQFIPLRSRESLALSRACFHLKWLKHMTATWDDERVARLVDKGCMEGLALYGLYWRVNEIIAAQMEGKNPSCSIRYTVTRWSLLLSLRGSLVFSTLSRLGATGLVTIERDGNEILVTNRNLLKYRDEYSRKSGDAQDNIPPRTEGDKEGEGETKTEGDKPPTAQGDKNPPTLVDIPAVFDLPLVDKTTYGVPRLLFEEYVKTYPGVVVMAELSKMRTWLLSNPKNMKTRTGMPRFMNSWLDRAQNNASTNGGRNAQVPAGKNDHNVGVFDQVFGSGEYRSGADKAGLFQTGKD